MFQLTTTNRSAGAGAVAADEMITGGPTLDRQLSREARSELSSGASHRTESAGAGSWTISLRMAGDLLTHASSTSGPAARQRNSATRARDGKGIKLVRGR